jgi:signal transduction histidine kinase/ligand-binding sensor domain-containing protein
MMFYRSLERHILRWMACATLTVPLPPAIASSPAEIAAPFSLRRWTTEDGLPKNTVISLLQTHNGYLWVGTREGLARFDGVRFKVFTDELRIDDSNIDCLNLAEDVRKRLWIRIPSGLVCYDRGRFEKFSIRSGPLQGEIQIIIASQYGGLWVGTSGDGLKRFEDGSYTRAYRTKQGLTSDSIGPLREDREGRVWIGCLNGPRIVWQRLDSRTDEIKPLSNVIGTTVPEIWDLHEAPDGSLWLVARDELLHWNAGKLDRFAFAGLLSTATGPVGKEGHDEVWFAPSFRGKLICFQQQHFEEYGMEHGLADTDFRCLLLDREGSLWVGMGAGGLQRLRPRSVISLLTTNASGGRQPIESVCPGRDGTVWLGTWDALLKWQSSGTKRFTNTTAWEGVNPEARYQLAAHPVLEDQAGQVWFGARNRGLFTLTGGEVVPVPAANDGRTNWSVTVLHETRSGTLWVGSDSGLSRKNTNGFTRYTMGEGLLDDFILGVQDGPDGSLWVGTPNGLHLFRDGRFWALTTRDGLLDNRTCPLLVEQDGTAWVGTPLGLNRIRGKEIRRVTQGQGLVDNTLFWLLDDGAGYYWANTVRGIMRVRKTDLNAVADGRQERLFCVTYGEPDGAASAEGSGHYQPNSARMADGRMWFSTTRGVAVVAPAALVEREAPPPVVIEQVVADGEVIYGDGLRSTNFALQNSAFKLPAGRAKVLRIHYTANSLADPLHILFRFKLDGSDADWREITDERVAYYTSLRPGRYSFKVKAASGHGIWSDTPVNFDFSVAPHIYETWSFYGVCAVTGLLGAFGLHHRRVKILQRIERLEREQAVQAERARIARDLHDDLGANLTGIALKTNLVQRQLSDGNAATRQLDEIATSTRALVDNMRETIWALNPKHDTLESLVRFLAERVEDFVTKAGLRCRFELPQEVPSLVVPSSARHQISLLVKEALHNAVRHANAGEVQFRLEISRTDLCLRIADDGRGFSGNGAPTEPAKTADSSRGNGLSNMRHRVQSLGGDWNLETATDRGTRISVRIPLETFRQST